MHSPARKRGIAYRLSRFETEPSAGDWLVILTYAQAAIARDPECRQAFAEIAKFATRISRELVVDLDL